MGVSVIIPTLNEEHCILDCVRSAIDAGASEVIVVDGGSSDETVRVARKHARIVQARRGRARQMNAGAAEASGNVLLFLHADTRLPQESLRSLQDVLGAGAVAGCFRLRFEPSSTLLSLYGRCTALPLRSLCFGDRGLFVSRRLFKSLGGFADIPAFEDLDLVKRLTASGRFVFLREYVTTSSRRFIENGVLRQQALNLALWIAYHLGVSPWRLARHYQYDIDG